MPSREYRELRAIQGRPLETKDKRHGGDRHKDKKRGHGKGGHTLSKWERRKIVAWDGEGANLDDGRHVYNLLANSDGVHIFNPEGLGTKEVFDYFVSYGDPRAINVIFGGSYDVNMLLIDMPEDKLRQLWVEGSCFWDEYRIFYASRKKFTVQKFYKVGRKWKKASFTLWDVIGYFQCSFVVACRKWLGDLPILDNIERMKAQRSTFDLEAIGEIIEYNKQELVLLVMLMEALFDAMDTAEIKLVRYDGAGSIAAALLRKFNVIAHKGDIPAAVNRYAQYAYSGGRIEACKVGNYEAFAHVDSGLESLSELSDAARSSLMADSELLVHRNDINSAYPSEMVKLPSYAGATWEFVEGEDSWDGTDNSMVHVRWHINSKEPFYPLWYREHDGTILYPQWGEGIYWGSELRNLTDNFPGQYEILDAVNVTLANDEKPFAFVTDLYEIRRKYKEAGNMASEALKLGYNSLYGKCVQQAGYHDGRIPTYHNLLWGGQTCAGVRRQMYLAATQCPDDIIAFATDAIISLKPLDISQSSNLGEWTYDCFSGITIVQPGVYWLKHIEHNKDCPPDCNYWQEKYRGFDKGSLTRWAILECWRNGTDYRAPLTRFVGMGSALMAKDLHSVWRTWPTEQRTLSLKPGGKRMEGPVTCYDVALCDTIPATNMNTELLSMPYALAWIEGENTTTPKVDGVDVDILEDEYLDSYA